MHSILIHFGLSREGVIVPACPCLLVPMSILKFWAFPKFEHVNLLNTVAFDSGVDATRVWIITNNVSARHRLQLNAMQAMNHVAINVFKSSRNWPTKPLKLMTTFCSLMSLTPYRLPHTRSLVINRLSSLSCLLGTRESRILTGMDQKQQPITFCRCL